MNYEFLKDVILHTGDVRLQSFFCKLQRAFYGSRSYYIAEFRKELESSGIVDATLIGKARECVFFYNHIKERKDLHCAVDLRLLDPQWIGILRNEIRKVFEEHFTDSRINFEESEFIYYQGLAKVYGEMDDIFSAATFHKSTVDD